MTGFIEEIFVDIQKGDSVAANGSKPSLGLASMLRQVRDAVIEVECRACGQCGSLDRAAVMEKQEPV